MSQCSADAQQRGDAVRHPRKRGGEVGGGKKERCSRGGGGERDTDGQKIICQ